MNQTVDIPCTADKFLEIFEWLKASPLTFIDTTYKTENDPMGSFSYTHLFDLVPITTFIFNETQDTTLFLLRWA